MEHAAGSPPAAAGAEVAVLATRPVPPGGTPWARCRRVLTLLAFMSPAGIVGTLFYLVPFVLTVLIAFTDMSVLKFGFGRADWVGLQNFRLLLESPWTPKLLRNTLFYVATTVTLFNFGMALVLGFLTTHIRREAGVLFRAVWLLPRITPSVVYIMMWKYLAADAPYGVVNAILSPLGVPPQNWVAAKPWLMVILVNGFIGASFGMIIFSSAIEALPREQLMASRVDGATALQTIRYVSLPQLRWPMLFVLSYQTLSLLTSFEQILLLTDGGPGFYTTEVWALHAYHQALSNYWGNQQLGYGSAMAAVLVVIGVIMALVYLRFFRFRELMEEPRIEVR